MRRAAVVGIEALNRSDFEAAFALYVPEVELVAEPRLVEVGFDATYRGRAERVRFQQRWMAEWGGFQIAPDAIVDLGERALITGRIVVTGLSSGAGIESPWSAVITLSPRGVAREEFFFDHDAGMRAAGLLTS